MHLQSMLPPLCTVLICTHLVGSFFDTHGVQYVCVSGRAVRGDQRAHRSTLARYSYNSYKQVRSLLPKLGAPTTWHQARWQPCCVR